MSEMIRKLHAQQGIRNFVEKHIDPHHTMSDFKLNKDVLLPFLKQHKLPYVKWNNKYKGTYTACMMNSLEIQKNFELFSTYIISIKTSGINN
jgi:hypothetical protein